MGEQRRSPFRVVVTTDPELDDLNSMLRLLLHSNEIEIAGLVYSASGPHHRGDTELGIEPHRWPAPGERLHIDEAVDTYALVWPNLVRHDDRYPHPDQLRSLIRVGNVVEVGDLRAATPGSDLVAAVLLDHEPGEVFVQAWGGMNTIARALLSIEEAYAESPDWESVYRHVVERTVVTSFGLQDDTFAGYVRPHWRELRHREVATRVWGYGARDVVPPADARYLSAEWMREHVSSVGPIGSVYRVWGDGKQMAAGFDDEDYFGLADATRDELEASGFRVWTPPQPAGSWISEGDSSNLALLVDNGLRSWEHPNHGGWGGRQAPSPDDPYQWSNRHAADAAADGSTPRDFHAARWFAAIQNDFAARLRWSVTADVALANHHPVVTVAQGLEHHVVPGTVLALDACVEDPDGDDVEIRWWQYREAGTHPGAAPIEVTGASSVALHVPADASVGDTIHVIVEATDHGRPPLTRYARIIVTIAEPSS